MRDSSPARRGLDSGSRGRRTAWLFAAAALLLAGCDEDQVVKPGSPVESEITLRVGEHRVLEPQGMRLGFERVVADSRCPTRIVCVWAGEATIRLWLAEKSLDTTFLELRMPGPFAAAETLGLRLDPVKLEPVPEIPGPIPPSSYRLTLKLTTLPD